MQMPDDGSERYNFKKYDVDLNDDGFDYKKRGGFRSGTMLAAIVVCACMIVTIVALILLLSGNAMNNRTAQLGAIVTEAQKDPQPAAELEVGDITSDELTFWEEYRDKNPTNNDAAAQPSNTLPVPKPAVVTDATQDNTAESEINETNDGKHTLIVHRDGREEWIRIDPYLAKNEYDFSNLVYNAPIMKYYESGKKHSFFGVDISKANGEVDFSRLKRAGAEFCIIRIGARGYGGGEIKGDEAALDNIVKATEAELAIGVDFVTQAINEQEAQEEAVFVATFLMNNQITPVYPVVCRLEGVVGDTARTDVLTSDNRSKIVLAFINTLKGYGYKSCVYGDKEWLLTKINQSILSESNVWLSQQGDMPDFPYRFNMWQYSSTGKIDGVTGEVGLNISFVDYSSR